MKKLLSILFVCILLTAQYGCGTLYGGQISQCQAHKPPKGQPTRAIRPAAFTCDIVFGFIIFAPITLGIDFLDGAIYKPCEYVTTNNGTPNGSLKPVTNSTSIIENQKDTSIKQTPNQITPTQSANTTMVFTPSKGTTSYLDYKNGFRDMKFETELPNDGTMVLIGDTIRNNHGAGMKFYSRTTDNLTIGDYQLQSIIYGYYKGQLDYIQINTMGYTNSRGVLAMLQDLFGNGFKDNEYIEEYAWFGSKVTLLYDENSISNNAHVYFSDKKLDAIQGNDEKKMQKNAESGF